MRKLIDTLFDLAAYLAGLFMIATLLAVLISIVGRLVPSLDLPGSDAYAGYCMAAAGFLALAPTLRRGEHIRVTLIFNQLPAGARHWLDIFCHLVALGLASALGRARWPGSRSASSCKAANSSISPPASTPRRCGFPRSAWRSAPRSSHSPS